MKVQAGRKDFEHKCQQISTNTLPFSMDSQPKITETQESKALGSKSNAHMHKHCKLTKNSEMTLSDT